MVLTLEIKGALAEKLGPSARKVFNASGGSIGRLPNNSWALPDPYVSGRHAVITYVDGVFYLEDTSTNGIWVNSQENRLVKGQLYAIRSGDWIFIEPYEISAYISEHEEASPPAKPRANASPFLVDPFAPPHENARASKPPLPPDDPSVADAELDPLALLNLRSAPNADRVAPKAADLARKPIVSEHYAPPRPVAPDPVSSPRPAAALIPDDYNPLVPDDQIDVSRPVAAPPRSASPVPASEPEQSPRSEAEPALLSAPRGPSSRQGSDAADTDLQAMLAGAGLENVPVTNELARDFGRILRVVVAGLMDVLQARQRLKSEFRIEMTMFRQADNNPLKFSANVDDALHNLLVKRNAAYLGPVAAFEDAFDDVRNHQLAILAGVRVAFESMLAEFDPERLQAEFDRQLQKGGLLSGPAKRRYWELYREKIRDMVTDADRTFSDLFGNEFARAYEEQLKRLKAQSRTPKN